jgi:site-specific recombinase XerD
MKETHRQLFKEYLEQAHLAGHTVQGLIGLRTRVPKFFIFIEEKGLEIYEVSIREAQDYQGWLIETGRRDGGKYSPRTVNAYLIAVTNFYEFVKRKGMVASNPFKEIKKMRINKKLPRNLLKEDQMNLFLKKLSRYDEGDSLKTKITQYRVHVIAELLYATGLRISEVANLRVEDINFTRGTVTVREGKGKRTRTAWLNDYAKDILQLYVEQMREPVFNEWNEKNGTLFGVRWQSFDKMVNKVLNKTAKELGFSGFTAHRFRHAVGYHLLRAGCNIRYIQEILGHKLLRNTEIYTKVDREDLKEVLDTYHPRKFRSMNHEKTDNTQSA